MRLIDADRLIDEFEDTIGNPISRTRLKLQVQNQPTIDAVGVVRCKNCKHWNTEFTKVFMCYCPMEDRWTGDDYYCASGERKDDE